MTKPGGVLVALVHGTMDRAASFAKVAARLRADGLEPLAYDRPGYASAAEQPPFTDVHAAAADLVRRIEQTGATEAVAVGHSFGGHLAVLAAMARPDLVRAVGVFETPYSWEPFWPPDTSGGKAMAAADAGGTTAAVETFMTSLVGERGWGELPEATRRLRIVEGAALVADLASIRTPAYDLRDLPVPLVAGRGSEAQPHQRAGTDWALATAPDVVPFVIEGAGHGAHRSHPAQFAAFVRLVVSRAQTRT